MLQVAAAIIRRGGRILICRRGPGGNCAWLWEFPGGKLEPGETPDQCAVRECREELGADIRVTGEYGKCRYRYPDREIALTFLDAELFAGEPRLTVHSDMRWVTPGELTGYTFCPADREIILRLAERD